MFFCFHQFFHHGFYKNSKLINKFEIEKSTILSNSLQKCLKKIKFAFKKLSNILVNIFLYEFYKNIKVIGHCNYSQVHPDPEW